MASVKVAVRVRPINQRELDLESRCIIQMEEKKTRITNVKVADSTSEGDTAREALRVKDFTYDFSFWSYSKADPHYASQEEVFQGLGVDVITNSYEGYNNCVFAYGQTGSGKTYTMMGHPDDLGLIPRICEGLFARMTDESTSYRVEVSYLEIYNEKVRDLLKYSSSSKNSHSLRVREHPKEGPYVQDLSKHIVNNYSDIEELMVRGNNNRTTAATNMNDTSSRSHAIFTLVFTQANFSKDMPSEMTSKVHLVDLAGSERADATGATGQRLKEGSSINKSLVTLGNVISVLAEMSEKGSKSKTFIPYRDSTLTWLLKDSLGGNAKTVMVATISPADVNYGESLSTLRYSNRAKDIINKPTVNEDPNVKLIRELRAEISRLKALLGGHIDGVFTPKVQEKLHESEARVKVLTEEWAGKWRETASVLQQETTLALRKEGFGVVLDSELPHLIGIDDDIISTGIMLYHLKEGRTTIGRTDADLTPDIVLAGLEVERDHCVILNTEGVVTFFPAEGALCTVNGVSVQEETRLTQGAVILLGRTNIFRFNNPAEAAKMRQELKASNLSVSRTSLLSQSMTDVSMYKSHENLLTMGPDFENIHREELEKLEEKRQQIELMEERYRLGEEERLSKQVTLERELDEKGVELEQMQLEAERIKKEAETAQQEAEKEKAKLKRRSMDLEKQVLELEGEREKERARIEREKESEEFQREKEREDLEREKEAIWMKVEEEISGLVGREREVMEQARLIEEQLTRELEQLKEGQETKMTELKSELQKFRDEENQQQQQLDEAEQRLREKKETIESGRQQELQLIESEREKVDGMRKEIQWAQRKGVLEAINSSVNLAHKEDDMRTRWAEILHKDKELEEEFSRKEKELEDKKKEQLAEFDRKVAGVEEAEKAIQERETKHKHAREVGDFETEVEREELEGERQEIEREKRRLEGELASLMEEEESMTQIIAGQFKNLEQEKHQRYTELGLEKTQLQELRQKQLDDLEEIMQEKNRMMEDREASVQQKEAQLLDMEDQHLISVSKLTDQRMELETDKEKLETALRQKQEELHQLSVDIENRRTSLNNDTATQLEKIEEERHRLHQLQEEYQRHFDDREKILMSGRSETDTYSKIREKYGVTDDDVSKSTEEKVQELEEIERRVEEIKLELEEKKRKLEEERDSELDKIEFEKLKLQEMEHQERINNLVEQEVKRRLFEEKVQREKQWRMERLRDKEDRERDIDRMRKAHDRELRHLKAKYEKSNGTKVPHVNPTKSNPYATVMSPDIHTGVPEIRVRNASSSSGSSNKTGSSRTGSHGNGSTTVTISIPTYRLSGHGADSHYEYEVKLCVGEESWSIYRRYSRFRELHHRVKKKIPEVGALIFPPKKLFSRSEKVVSERRKQLEQYLQNFIDVCRHSSSSPLQASTNRYITKQFLCDFQPFFKKGIFETTKHSTT